MRPSSFGGYVFNDTGDTWKSDLDVRIPPLKLALLEANTEVSQSIISKVPLLGNCDHFYSPSDKSIHAKWVMPIGLKTSRPSFGLQYCPCCLAEDGKMPYFRKHWRLGFFSACLFHGVQLHDRCPSCSKPINIQHINKHIDKLIYYPEDVAFCQHCGFDLRTSTITHASSNELEINRQHFTLYTLGYGTVGNVEFNYSNLYFEGIRRLLSFIVCDPFGSKMFIHLRDKLELYYPYHRELVPRHSEIEFMDIKARRVGLIMIKYLMEDWPRRFIEAAALTGVSSQFFSTPNVYFPYWVSDVLKFKINLDPVRLGKDEHRNAKAFLERRLGRCLKSYEVVKYVKQLYSSNNMTEFRSLKALRTRRNRDPIGLYSLNIVLRRQLRIVCMKLYQKGVPPLKIANIYGIRKNNIWKWVKNEKP